METILIVEDDDGIRMAVEESLRFQGYRVMVAPDGEEGLRQAVDARPDLIVLDIMLPRLNGFELLRLLRQRGIDIPVIVLTAKVEESDKLLGFGLGADDYVTKPFSVRELGARVGARLRRTRERKRAVLCFGQAELHINARRLLVDGREVPLTPREFDLLCYLAENPGRALARDELLNRVWGFDFYGTPRTVDRFVAALRKKVESDPEQPRHILTVRGYGYRFSRGDESGTEP